MLESSRLWFLDGYMYRVMAEMLRSGAQESGLYEYYQARIEKNKCALSEYDWELLNYVQANFDSQRRQVVHAGVGVGTLACGLALVGFKVCALERDAGRVKAASVLRSAVCEAWPAVEPLYELRAGTFPMAVADTPWIDASTLLIFTNCGAGWSKDFTFEIIRLLPRFGDVILDARLFGKVRDTEIERKTLIASIERTSLVATPLPQTQRFDAYYYHIRKPQ